MANYVTDNAVIVRVQDFSETSQVATLFTAANGLVPVIAKGSKRQSKTGATNFAGPLDLLCGGEAVFIPAKTGQDLGIMTGWQILDHRAALRKSLPALHAGLVCTEITTLLLHPHDPHEALYPEFSATLELLWGAQRMRAVVAYAKTALRETGYEAELKTCVSCGVEIAADMAVRFSTAAGGILCGNCRGDNRGKTISVAGRIVVALERLPTPGELAKNPPERPADAKALHTALELLLAQVEAITDRPVKTRWLLPGIFV